MRRTTTLSLLTTTVLTLSLVSTAQSVQAAQAALTCPGGVIGVDGAKRVHALRLKNDRVTGSERSRTKLSFRPTAWGFYDSQDTKAGSVLRMNTVTRDGEPRRVTLSFKDGSSRFAVSSSKYDQSGFEPRLFADGFTYYAYTVNGSGKLQRWALTRHRNGDLRFGKKVTVGSGYGDLTSLQTSQVFKSNGANREYLYAATSSGALVQIAVPLKKPKKEKLRTLLAAGYGGVTELAWSFCDGDATYASLWAIDPVAGTTSWTTVENSVSNPVTTLHGTVTGGGDWNFSAAY